MLSDCTTSSKQARIAHAVRGITRRAFPRADLGSKTALSTLISSARAIAERLAGIVEDPQEDSLSLPREAKRYEKPKREERFTVLDLSWWYMASPLRRPTRLAWPA